jgi:serine/threonine-protein kinase
MQPMSDTESELGRIVDGRYRITSLLGEGNMAKVYVAEQVSMKRKVALKILHEARRTEGDALARFQREVDAVIRLRSPHCITFYDFGQTERDGFYIAMELLQGESLRDRLEREPVLAPSRVASIVRQICGCLSEAHAAGVLHRDLKPENIFLCPPQAGEAHEFVKVLDFGLAKLIHPQDAGAPVLTAPKMTVGTPAYLAPEMARSGYKRDGRVDLYALGVMVFEMLSGQRPFNANSPGLMLYAHVCEPVPAISSLRPELPAEADGFFMTALAKDPALRFSSADTFATVLAGVLE